MHTIGNLNWLPSPWIYTVAGILLTTLVSLGGFVIKNVIQAIRKEWYAAAEKLAVIEGSTRVTAENHLTHIQAETEKQTELLERVIGQITETDGYLRAVVDYNKK